ncbi:hypothetical protein CHUAL_006512 [Chamberlinius hualienensis]
MYCISIILVTFSVNFVVAQQSPTCNGDIYEDYDSANTGVANCTFPYYKINSECIINRLSQLSSSSLCPINKDQTLNLTNIEKATNIINQILKDKSICGFQINPIKLPPFTFISDGLLEGTGVRGECGVAKDTSVVKNVNNTVVSLKSTAKTLTFDINAPDLTDEGALNCQYRAALLPDEFQLNNITFSLALHATATFTISINDKQLKATIQSPKATIHAGFHGFDQISALKQFHIGDSFGKLTEKYVGNSKIAEIYSMFIAAIVKEVFTIVKNQC